MPLSTTPAATPTPSETLPSSTFESLLPKLLTILQITQRPEGTINIKNKQDLLQAVSPPMLPRVAPTNPLRGRANARDIPDPGVSRSPQPGALTRECAPGRRTAHRGARRDHRHARETTRKEAVRRCHSCGEKPDERIVFYPENNCASSRTR